MGAYISVAILAVRDDSSSCFEELHDRKRNEPDQLLEKYRCFLVRSERKQDKDRLVHSYKKMNAMQLKSIPNFRTWQDL